MSTDLRNAVGGTLYFPVFKRRRKADRAVSRLLDLPGVEAVEVEPYGAGWVALAHAPLVGIGTEEMEELGNAVERVARRCGGTLDGWESGWLTRPSDEVAGEDTP